MKLEIPHSVILPDGAIAQVKGVAAKVVDGRLNQIIYTVEKASGAWTDVLSEEVQQSERASSDHLEVQQVV